MPSSALHVIGLFLLFVCLGSIPLPCTGESGHAISPRLSARAHFYHHKNQHQGERANAFRYTRMEILRAKCRLGRKNKHLCQTIQQQEETPGDNRK